MKDPPSGTESERSYIKIMDLLRYSKLKMHELISIIEASTHKLTQLDKDYTLHMNNYKQQLENRHADIMYLANTVTESGQHKLDCEYIEIINAGRVGLKFSEQDCCSCGWYEAKCKAENIKDRYKESHNG